jgi:hypothetical protein
MRSIWPLCAAGWPAATNTELREGDVQSGVGCRPRSRRQCSRIECGFVSPWKPAGQSFTFVSINSYVALFAQTMPKRELFQDQLRNHQQSVLETIPASKFMGVGSTGRSNGRLFLQPDIDRRASRSYTPRSLWRLHQPQLLTTWPCKRPRGGGR